MTERKLFKIMNYPLKKLFILFLLTVLHSTIFLAQQKNYENLVFEGAGIKGLAYSGVLRVMEDNQQITKIKNVGGTSAGAITAMMIALGYQSQEVYDIISETDFQEFNDGGHALAGGVYRMIKEYGWYKGDKLKEWLENLIDAKTGNPDITFKELHQCLNPLSEYKIGISNEILPTIEKWNIK